jgi:hypothetical protein
MIARALLAACIVLAAAGTVPAVTVDDFTAGFPTPGGVVTDASGVGLLTQTNVLFLGGTRETRVSVVNPAMPGGVTIIPNPSPPPTKNVLEGVIGGAGGDTRLSYPGLTSYDITLANAPAFPSAVEVRVALLVAGGTLELTLSDSTGSVATASLPTGNFSGGNPTGLASYLFFPAAASFPGVDLTDIDNLSVRVAQPTGSDFELSEIRIVPVAAAATTWDRAFMFERASGAGTGPHFMVGFDALPPSPAVPPVLDLSDPLRPSISWVSGVQPDPFFEILVGAYGGISPEPFIGPGALEIGLTNASTYRMVFEVTSSGGEVVDSGSLVGFNPRPEPPLPSLYDWGGVSPEPFRVGFGLSLGLMAPPAGAAPAGVGDESVTLSFQVLGPGDVPVPLQQVQLLGPAVPALPIWTAVALAALLLAAVVALARARPGAGAR